MCILTPSLCESCRAICQSTTRTSKSPALELPPLASLQARSTLTRRGPLCPWPPTRSGSSDGVCASSLSLIRAWYSPSRAMPRMQLCAHVANPRRCHCVRMCTALHWTGLACMCTLWLVMATVSSAPSPTRCTATMSTTLSYAKRPATTWYTTYTAAQGTWHRGSLGMWLSLVWFLPQVRERAHFSAFIDGDFGAYIAEKRQNAVWGDDPEIQVCV